MGCPKRWCWRSPGEGRVGPLIVFRFLLCLFVCLFSFPFFLSLHQAGDDLGDAKPLGGVAHLGSPLSLPFPLCCWVCFLFFFVLFFSLYGRWMTLAMASP